MVRDECRDGKRQTRNGEVLRTWSENFSGALVGAEGTRLMGPGRWDMGGGVIQIRHPPYADARRNLQ